MIIAVALGLMLLAAPSWAATVNASSCSAADISTAISSASDGDTVQIPGGTCTTTSTITITNKSITLQGVGAGTQVQCDVGGQTTYTCLRRAGPIIDWTAKSTGGTPAGQTVLKDMTIDGLASATGCQFVSTHYLSIRGQSDAFHMSGMKFFNADNSCGIVLWRGSITGLVDHNEFWMGGSTSSSLVCTHESWKNVGSYGDNSWATADSIGAAGNGDALYFEDNVIDTTSSSTNVAHSDSRRGCRWVLRFNTINGGKIDHHGTESDGRPRGPRSIEVYRNALSPNGKTLITAFGLRGVGTARVFDNTATYVSGSFTSIMSPTYTRGSVTPTTTSYSPWGYCRETAVTLSRSGTTATATTAGEHGVHAGGSYITIAGAGAPFDVTAVIGTRVNSTSFTYTVTDSGSTSSSGTLTSPFDGNTNASGYACIDQIGRGQGSLLAGDMPNITVAGGSVTSPAQELNPYYTWNNMINGVRSNTTMGTTHLTDLVVANRDYYDQATSFDGTVGIGRGLRASRPATCTTGVAYWSTDGGGDWNTSTTETYSDTPGEDGGLDKCTATNTWTDDWYVPYTYPHPMADGGSPPADPSNRRFSPMHNLRRADQGQTSRDGGDGSSTGGSMDVKQGDGMMFLVKQQ